MSIISRKTLFMTALAGLVMTLTLAAGAVYASAASAATTSTKSVSTSTLQRVSCRFGTSHAWTHLGGDPVWRGGVASVSQLSVVVHSAAGQRALTCLGLNQAEAKAVTTQIGTAHACTMHYGESFIAMSFHSDGASVDRPTQFLDPRFHAGAAAFCLTVTIPDGKNKTETIQLLWPEICVNASLVSQTVRSTPVMPKKPKLAPKPPAKTGKVTVTKVAKDSTGKVMPTPTGTFVFQKVTNGLSTKVTYNYNPQSLGTCVIGQNVKVSELKPLAGAWKYETPAVQTKKCTSNTHFGFIDRETAPPTTPGPAVLCVSNGVTYYVGSPPAGYVSTDSSGNCVFQTISHSCDSTGVPGAYWSDTFQACVVNNCGNVVVINGNNTGTINIGGNCNAAPPTPTPTPTCQTPGATNIGGVLPCLFPPPVQHYTNVSCTWQEEITGGGSSLVVCQVSDDNGAPISLFAQSQDSNSQVSGIICYSQGTPSCQGNGTFNFRVDGFNNGTSPVVTKITVYATANGVNSATQTITINVDPSSNGFNG